MKGHAWILSCEHAGNAIPDPWDRLVKIPKKVLESHEGVDIGALEIAESLQGFLACPLYFETATRLLVEQNRSLHHPKLFSRYCDGLSQGQKKEIIDTIYQPYHRAVEEKIVQLLQRSSLVIHISVHTFTPVLKGEVRNTDIGLLYDPRRPLERKFCRDWRSHLKKWFKVRMNYPYRGTADGFTTSLRKKFSKEIYCGIELEVNQSLVKSISKQLGESLFELQGDVYK